MCPLQFNIMLWAKSLEVNIHFSFDSQIPGQTCKKRNAFSTKLMVKSKEQTLSLVVHIHTAVIHTVHIERTVHLLLLSVISILCCSYLGLFTFAALLHYMTIHIQTAPSLLFCTYIQISKCMYLSMTIKLNLNLNLNLNLKHHGISMSVRTVPLLHSQRVDPGLGVADSSVLHAVAEPKQFKPLPQLKLSSRSRSIQITDLVQHCIINGFLISTTKCFCLKYIMLDELKSLTISQQPNLTVLQEVR